MFNSDSIEEKIEKLLRLSLSNNPNEARAALLKAQELMLKYNVDHTSFKEKREVKTVSFDLSDPEINLKMEDYYQLLAMVIAKNFRAKTFVNSSKIFFIAINQDAKAIINLFSFIMFETELCFDTYIKFREQSEIPLGDINFIKKEWFYGFISGLDMAFEKQKIEKDFSLLLITPKEVEEKFNELNLKDQAQNKEENKFDIEAWLDGIKNGDKILDKRTLTQNGLLLT